MPATFHCAGAGNVQGFAQNVFHIVPHGLVRHEPLWQDVLERGFTQLARRPPVLARHPEKGGSGLRQPAHHRFVSHIGHFGVAQQAESDYPAVQHILQVRAAGAGAQPVLLGLLGGKRIFEVQEIEQRQEIRD